MTETLQPRKKIRHDTYQHHQQSISKLAPIPKDHRIQKRPLLHPPIPSLYTTNVRNISTTGPTHHQPKGNQHARPRQQKPGPGKGQGQGSKRQHPIYISTHTPFVSAVKRVRKCLETFRQQQQKERLQLTNITGRATTQKKNSKRSTTSKDAAGGLSILSQLEDLGSEGDAPGAEVVLKGTNRAIPKVLNLALYFLRGSGQNQGQSDCNVVIHTGSVGTVDDIVPCQKHTTRAEGMAPKKMEKKNKQGKGGNKPHTAGAPTSPNEMEPEGQIAMQIDSRTENPEPNTGDTPINKAKAEEDKKETEEINPRKRKRKSSIDLPTATTDDASTVIPDADAVKELDNDKARDEDKGSEIGANEDEPQNVEGEGDEHEDPTTKTTKQATAKPSPTRATSRVVEEDHQDPIPESRVRWVSVVEAYISLK